MGKLTLAEIAAEYRVSPKTFSRIVRAKKIPHDVAGRRMLFELAVVKPYMAAEVPDERQKTARHFKGSGVKSATNKFAELVGI